MPRASHIQKAERINLARILLQRYQHWPQAAQQLARNCSISERQAYRYLEQAQRLKHPVPVGDVKVSFTVKLSRRLVQRLRAYAASTDYCRTSWFRPTNCSRRTGAGRLLQVRSPQAARRW